jgi:hypothetical protein
VSDEEKKFYNIDSWWSSDSSDGAFSGVDFINVSSFVALGLAKEAITVVVSAVAASVATLVVAAL